MVGHMMCTNIKAGADPLTGASPIDRAILGPNAVEVLSTNCAQRHCARALRASMDVFSDDDAGYLDWLAAHPDGHVLNTLSRYNPTVAKVHHAICRAINGHNPRGGKWTHPYIKVCADDVEELDQWPNVQTKQPISRCLICYPGQHVVRPVAAKSAKPSALPPLPAGRRDIREPTANSPALEAWAEDYIRFERRPQWQEQLRTEIRTLSRQLKPSNQEVLHATFFGTKRDNADVENLVLYNIGTFSNAGRNGIRFEHGSAAPPSPDGTEYPFAYRYALAPRSNGFDHWKHGRQLASFDWIDLSTFAGEKKLAKIWLALKRAQVRAEVEVFEPARAPDTPFAVKLEVRPPHGSEPVWCGLVKEIFDGVISAFQAHTDATVLPDVAERLAKYLAADSVEITEHLLDQGGAVLGLVPRLVKPFGKGVQWNPADHLCVAGELLAATPDHTWAIRGEIVELSR
jgi:hypothetical protein